LASIDQIFQSGHKAALIISATTAAPACVMIVSA
jgi:hypothetical protein